jgi:hypothetical protein
MGTLFGGRKRAGDLKEAPAEAALATLWTRLARLMATMRLTSAQPILTAITCTMLSGCAADPRPAVSAVVADNVPMWLGGMPKDVPPRPGTPEHNAWQQKRAEEAATIKSKLATPEIT